MFLSNMKCFVRIKSCTKKLADRLSDVKHGEISKTVLFLTASIYLACQIMVLVRKEDFRGDILKAKLQHTTKRLRQIEATLQILENTVLQLLKEKHAERTKRMAMKIPRGLHKKKRRPSTRSFRHEIHYLKRKMKAFEKRFQCAMSDNETDNRGRLCGNVGRLNRKGEKDPKPNVQASGNGNQKQNNKVSDLNDGRSRRKPSRRSTVFIRWGTAQCRTSNKSHTSLVYAGRVASPHYKNKGGGSNYLCMPDRAFYTNPKNISNTDRAFLFPVKYGSVMTIFTKFTQEIIRLLPPEKRKLIKAPLDYKDVPCAVCRVDGATTALMIPAHNYCPPKWDRQYHGYLMSQKHDSEKSEFVCVDVEAEGIPNTKNQNGDAFLHLTEYNCGTSRCGGYHRNKALTCAVCTT